MMGTANKQGSDAWEQELQELFDSTSADAGADRLNRLARFSAEIPKEVSLWLNPFFRHFGAASCLVLGLVVLWAAPWGNHSDSWSTPPMNLSPESSFIVNGEFLDESFDWDSGFTTVGFDLLHGANRVDQEMLEDSFQALLSEKDGQ